MSKPTSKVKMVRVAGPLAPYADEFTHVLIERGYTPLTRTGHLRVMSHMSRWLQVRGLSVVELTAGQVDEYLAGRRDFGYTAFRSRTSLDPLLGVLAARGAPIGPATTASAATVSRTDALLTGYERFLREERGLAASTTAAHVLRAGWFVASYAGDGDLRAITAETVSDAVLVEAERLSVSSVRALVSALRWLLRYAYLTGLVDADLSAAALPVTGRPRSSLPRGISQAGAAALEDACDRRTSTGRRDYAVILTLLRLGLRAGEVAGLRLEDLDWRAGLFTVRGKGHRVDQLPLPSDVGAAIAAYLRNGRPSAAGRGVFVTARAPHEALSRTGVSWIVRRASARAGMAPVGAHALRHGLACQLLRAGAPLREIGQLLRQQAEATVSVYARVDVDRLRTIARPWPGLPSGSTQ